MQPIAVKTVDSPMPRGGATSSSGNVRFRCTFHNTIYDVFRARGWQETDSDTDWDVAWVDTGWLRENFEW